jgi:hypothetical protein
MCKTVNVFKLCKLVDWWIQTGRMFKLKQSKTCVIIDGNHEIIVPHEKWIRKDGFYKFLQF